MGGLKTYLATFAIAMTLSGPVSADEALLRAFANCAGQMSAEMEHQWLLSDPEADRTEQRRDAVLSVLEAIMPADRGRDVLSWRIDAKMAQAVLLQRGTFNDDPADAAWARRHAETIIAGCNGLILS